MEGQVWTTVQELLLTVEGKPAGCQFSDQEILRMSLWAILHDRPMSWACRPENWSEVFRPARLPDDSTVSRRWKRPELRQKALLLHQEGVRRCGGAEGYVVIDGRSLVVGGCSKDPDARPGRAAGGMGKGYKMHTLVNLKHVILAYDIRPMNEAEPTVAQSLVAALPASVTRVLGDGAYDSMRLHHRLQAMGKKLYTPLRQNRVGRRRQPPRVRLLRLWQRRVGRQLLRIRNEVERTFGQESNVAFGFKQLPPWARRSRRVFRWMWGKNLLHNVWLLTKSNAA